MSSFYSDSSFNPKVISDTNDVRIIEPNPLGEIVPLEDMSIFLSLQAKQKSKSVITQIADNKFSINTKIANTIDLITPQDTTTINEDHLFKSKVNLTTDWTEIGGGPNIELYKDFEGFGITNVDIEIKSQVAPKVVIDFIDVRGATLFEQGSCSPYGLFFNLPYPIFELTVKGYYGKPVKYYLNLVKFNTKFNSDTGNMECKGEFIGYSFAFLSDTIVGYVGASQFLNSSYDPQGKLKQKYLDTKKFYKDNGLTVEDPVKSGTPWCDNPALPGRCYTIQDLLHKIQDFEKKTQPLIANSPEFSKLTNLIQLQNDYAQYIEVVNKFMFSLAQDGYGVEIQTSAAYGSGVEKKERLVFKDQTILNYLLDPSTASTSSIIYNHFVKTPTPGIFPLNIQITKSFKIEENVYADKVYADGLKMLTSATGSQLGGDPASGFDTIYDSLNLTNWHNILDNASLGYKKNDTTTTEKYLDMGWIIKDIEDEKAKLDKVVDDYRKEVIADINKLVVDRIGFNPTIRNIFTILLCNTDAFMEILLEVAVKAENYHISNSLEDWVNDKTINSTGTKKVYAWPAYIEKTFLGVGNSGANEVQGTKEAYPGKNTEFANWPEVRFVEDFIQAFLEYQRDIDLLNEDKAGKAGWDNYVPITPLEAPVWGDNNPIKYYGLVNPNDIYRVVGERMFIACDHTLFSPIRLTNDATFIPNVGLGNWTPLSNTSYDTSLASNFGEIDAWNLINSQEGDSGVRVLQSLLIGLTKDTFKTQVINVLKTKYSNSIEEDILASSLVTSNLLLSGTTPGIVSPFQESFTSTDLYKTFNPTDGIPLFDETSDTQVLITADPFNMGWANILQIIPETEVRKIEILPADGDFSKAVTKFSKKITTSTQAITFGSTEFKTTDNPQPKAIVDESQKTINFVDGRLFTTLGMKDAQADKFSSWWSVDTDLNGLPVSNMGLITAWDYQGNDGVLGISLLTNDGDSSKIFTQQYLVDEPAMTLGDQTGVDPYDQVEEDGISTAFVTTPLWMDNVNKFRIETGAGELQKPTTGYGSNLNTKQIQDRNLAYLFLHTCKPTPLIIRACSNSGFLLAITDSEDTGYEPSSTYSLKAFNTAGGIAKVPKMWALALGAQLWRWKMFVGVKADGKWNKPLQPYNTLAAGDLPTGFDPLAQPGWHSYDGKKREAHSGEAYTSTAWSFSPTTQITQKILSLSNIERNDIDIYLNKIYRSSTSWTPKIQTSSFSSNYLSAQGKYVKDWADDVIGFGLYQAWSLLSEPAKILAKGHGGDLPWTISQPVTGGLDGNVISSGVASITPNACVYFNYYGLLASGSTYGKISFGDGDIGTEDDPKGLQLSQIVNPNDASGQLWTAKKISDNYNWSQLWIAPHHIPYVHPEGFAGGKGEACSYVQVFTNTMDYLDYQTIMPEDRIGFGYKEMCNYGDTVTDVFKNLHSDPNVENLIDPTSMLRQGRFIHRDRVSDGNLGMVMQHLPDEVKDIFIKNFEEWVDSDFGGSSNNILKEIDPINFDNTSTGSLIGGSYSWSREISKTAVNGTTNNSVALALKPNLTETKKLVSEKYWILNSTPKIWYGIDSSDTITTNKFNSKFVISNKIFDEYLNSFFDTLQTNKTKKIDEIQKKNIEDNLGSSLKDDDVKLSFYRTFKSLTDKWISASDKNKLFFNLVESAGKNCKSGNGDGEKPTLASHFQYVNRVMGDIGNIAVLNVTKLLELKDNIKISLYQYISDLLAENEYLFFPLPGYINFTPQGTDKKDLEDMFRPTLSLDNVSCGPLFLSMYVGGNSKQLQIKSNANCPDDKKALQNLEDDGFSISNPLQTAQPAETKDPKLVGSKGYTAFKVVYGLDTQNHFKNIQLDQSEFSETAESLLAIDKLGKQGGTDQTSKGQNLNSIYLTRSYSCQVESLGNMMIQPMTYFDLIGVPMFSGAYLITEVRHNFKPNNATTTFKGTRQPRATIPIVVDAAIAMDMSFKDLKTNKVGQSIATVKTDGGTNTSQTQPEASNTNGNVSSSNVADDTFIVNYKTGVKQPWLDKSNGGLLPINAGNTVLVNLGSDYGSYTYFFHEAADAWKAMAAQMKTDTGVLISKTGSNYRTVDSQITLRKNNCGGNLTDRKASCSPQTAAVQELNGKIYSSSNHGYGMACDTTPFKGGATYYSVKLPSDKGVYSNSNVCKQEAKSLGFDDCTSLAVAKAKENSASYLSSGKLNLQKVKDFYANLTGNPTSDELRTMNDLALLWMQENAPSFGWQPLSSEPWHYEYTLQPDGGHPNFKSSYTGKIKSGDQYNVNKSNGYPDLTTLNNVKLVTASNATNTNNTGTVAKASQGKVKNVTLQNKLQSLGKIS